VNVGGTCLLRSRDYTCNINVLYVTGSKKCTQTPKIIPNLGLLALDNNIEREITTFKMIDQVSRT
jgi:hypothetical protein